MLSKFRASRGANDADQAVGISRRVADPDVDQAAEGLPPLLRTVAHQHARPLAVVEQVRAVTSEARCARSPW